MAPILWFIWSLRYLDPWGERDEWPNQGKNSETATVDLQSLKDQMNRKVGAISHILPYS